MPEELRPLHLAGFARYLESGEARVIGKTVELQGRRKDGSLFPLELSLATWAAGDKKRFTGILRDVTERRLVQARLEEALESERAAREQAEFLNEEFETFIYTVTHDLKNPLVAIIGFAEFLAREFPENGGRGQMLVERIRANGKYMQELIADLLELSRVGRTQTETEPVDLAALVTSVQVEIAGAFPNLDVSTGALPVVFMPFTRAATMSPSGSLWWLPPMAPRSPSWTTAWVSRPSTVRGPSGSSRG
jgi:signal transduction histidine kinase